MKRKVFFGVVFASLAAVTATTVLAAGKSGGPVHVTGKAYKLQGGDYVKVTYPGAVLNKVTAYGQYNLDVPYGVIVTAKICNNEGKQVSSVVAGAAWDTSSGGNARNNNMTMPDLSR